MILHLPYWYLLLYFPGILLGCLIIFSILRISFGKNPLSRQMIIDIARDWICIPFVAYSAGFFLVNLVALYVPLRLVEGYRFPYIVQMITFFLVFEFIMYLTHLMYHRVPGLWRIHAPHHRADGEGMDFRWTDAFSVGLVQQCITAVLFVLTSKVFGVGLIPAISVFALWMFLTALSHFEIPLRFGPLGRFFLAPETHRKHHRDGASSADFGVALSFFDTVFNTVRPRAK